MSIPPVLKKQLKGSSLDIERVDVEGDGYCGYYSIRLLEQVINGNNIEISELENLRNKIIQSISLEETLKERLVNCERHYLEYIEVGLLAQSLLQVNVGVVVQTDVKKTGNKRKKRTYPIRVVNYSINISDWVFLIMTHRGSHYEVLCTKGRFLFTDNQAKEFFNHCDTEFPTENVDPKSHVRYLDPTDFFYF